MTKTSRNDPCPCGSGKKYKNCCLAADESVGLPRQADQQANLQKISALIEQGVGLQRAGRSDEAEALYREVLALNPGDPDALHLLGVIARDAGQLDAAVGLFRQAIAVMPREANFHNNLGMAYRKLGQLELAVKSYEQALVIDPRHVGALNNLGTACQALDQTARAVSCFERALALKPDFAEAHFNLGNALQASGESEPALISYRQALLIRPAFVDALCNCGICLYALGRIDEAIGCFEQAINAQADFQPAYMNIGLIALVKGLADQALPFLHHANALDPQHAETLNYLAHAEKNLGLFKDAIDHSWQAFQLAPKTRAGLESAIRLALIGYLQNDRVAAGELLKQAAAISNLGDSPARVYWTYLGLLLSWWRKHPESAAPPSRVLYVLGDSHVLSVHGAELDYRGQPHRGQAMWVEGCKQWHLGQTERNSYQSQFESFLSGVPAGSPVLVCVGEIDCRLDDGIFKAWQKNRTEPLAGLVETTVGNFMRYLAAWRDTYGLELTVAGVPASQRVSAAEPAEDNALFLAMLADFNRVLALAARQAGMAFLDLFALTDAGGGYSNGRWHLDRIHLQPTAYGEAFARHLLPAPPA